MRRFNLSRCCRLAVGLVTGLAITFAAHADETGVVRISDRSAQPVIRAQSPDASPIEQASCQSGACNTSYGPTTCEPSCPPHGICGPSHGLVVASGPTCTDDEDWQAYEVADCPACVPGQDCPQCGGTGYTRGNLFSCRSGATGYVDCPHCEPGQNCRHCGGLGRIFGDPSRCRTAGGKCIDFFANGCDRILGRIHDRLGLAQSGGDGAGVPLVGCYTLTYPVDPSYFDGRDGQVYAAQGYGGPVSVPLAPVVRHTYNYGWGVPSSRLTPISHPIPPTP